MTDAGPVLTFVTSLRHPETTPTYAHRVAQLDATLRALDAQTDRRFKVVVVANQPYEVPIDLHFEVLSLTVDFPAPAGWNGPTGIMEEAVRLDKGSKYAVGLTHAESEYVMFLDSDDFVAADLTAFVAAHPGRTGWFVDRGIAFDTRTGRYRELSRFNEVCGTSLICARSAFGELQLPSTVSQEEVLDVVGEDRVLRELGSHRYLAERQNLAPLPLLGAAYAITGSNNSWQPPIVAGRQMSGVLASRFGISDLPPRSMARRNRAELFLRWWTGRTRVVLGRVRGRLRSTQASRRQA